jgi:thioesterase domain-containing protein/acyl carrier protein
LNALLNGGLDILPAKAIIFGGEVLNKQLVERIKRMSPTLEIYNHYGPTESTIGVTTYKVSGDEEEIPIGKPLNNTCVYLLDEEGAALPAGVEGEIYIGGESLANGYLNNPELTREKFITDPYYPDRKLFKTGDKGILDNEGNLLFRGRKDRQVKIRGNRVELREIEVCLEDLDIVSQAVVLTPSSKTKEQLWAVVQAKETADAEKIKALLIHALPGYMIPDRIFILNLIPVTSNGKTDYDKIHSLINEEKSRQNAAVQLESLTSDEQKIQAIFAKILGIECFGPDDSFFDLGGNSLSAIELLYHIKQTFQVNLPLAFLFHYSTIKKIAGELHKNNTFQPLVKMKEGCGDDVLVLVHPAGGDVFCYHTFSGQFVSDISIYGLQSRIVVSGDTNNAIKILADKYLSIIESQNIQGNLIFGGWSMGALIAFEMAVKYSAKKDLFPSVLIIDQTAYTHNVSTNSKDDMDRIVLFAEKVEHLIGEELGITREKIKDMSDWECSALFFEKFRHYGLVPESIEINDFHGFLELMIYHNEISLNYYPSDYKGKVIVVKSENPMMLRTGATLYSDERPRDLLWRTFAGEIHEITSPGNHVSMMRSPFVEVLVKRLEKILTP